MTDPQEARDAATRAKTARRAIKDALANADQANYPPDYAERLLALSQQVSKADAHLAQLIEEAGDDRRMINSTEGRGEG